LSVTIFNGPETRARKNCLI